MGTQGPPKTRHAAHVSPPVTSRARGSLDGGVQAACVTAANIAPHAKAKRRERGNVRGDVCAGYSSGARHTVHNARECEERAVRKPHDKPFCAFPTSFLSVPWDRWRAPLRLGSDVSTTQRRPLGSTKHCRSCVNNGSFCFFTFSSWTFWLYFFLKIKLPESEDISLRLYAIGRPIKRTRMQTMVLVLHVPNSRCPRAHTRAAWETERSTGA